MYNESFFSSLTNISFNSTPNMSDFILPRQYKNNSTEKQICNFS